MWQCTSRRSAPSISGVSTSSNGAWTPETRTSASYALTTTPVTASRSVAIAYEGYVSPSGVGYDIGCIAAGERVLCVDGCNRAIECAVDPVCADAGGLLRRVAPFVGVLARGRRPLLRLTLANGRTVRLTNDHEVRTDRGWVRADAL